MGLWWMLGYVAVGPLALALPDWRPLTLVCSAPALLTVVYIWVLPESPHWLAASGRAAAAERWFARAARRNGRLDFDLRDCHHSQPDHKAPEAPRRHLGHLLCAPVLLCQTLLMSYLWMCSTLVYYGLSLFSTSLVGDRHVNYVLSGAVELPVYFLISPMMNSRVLGRRWTIFVFHVAAGLALLSLALIPEETGSGASLRWLSTSLWLLGKASITATFASIFVFGAELFPTTIRTLGIGICSTMSKVGGVLAPYIGVLGETDSGLPALLFGALSLVAAAATLLLPETGHRRLPEDLPDVRPGPFLGLFVSRREKTPEPTHL